MATIGVPRISSMKTIASVRRPPIRERRAKARRIASGVARPKQTDQTNSVTASPPHWFDGTAGGVSVPDISIQLAAMTTSQARSNPLRQNRGCAVMTSSANKMSMTSNGRHCSAGG